MKDQQIQTKLFNLALDPVLEGRSDKDRYDILNGKGFKNGDFDALVPTYLSDRSLGEMDKDELIEIVNAFKGEYVKPPVKVSVKVPEMVKWTKPRVWMGHSINFKRWEWSPLLQSWRDYRDWCVYSGTIFVIGDKPTSPPPPKEELETCDKVDWL